MRQICLLVILVTISSFCKGQTNIYHPLPDSNYYWHVIDLASECETGSSDTIQSYFIYSTLSGDTIVDTKVYKKVFATNISNEKTYFHGYLFEDSLNRKIYVVTDDPDDHTITSVELLYDYNTEIGATVDSFYEFRGFSVEHPANSIVFGIDSVEIENSFRRRIGIQYELLQCDDENPIKLDTVYWIEGIGSSLGFTLPNLLPLNPNGELAADVLACVWKNDSLIFSNYHKWHTCDSIFIVYDEINEQVLNNSFSVYPQPADVAVYLKMNNDYMNEELSIQISDLYGRKIIYTKYLGNEIITIPIDKINPGIYILTIQIKQRALFSKELIIQH